MGQSKANAEQNPKLSSHKVTPSSLNRVNYYRGIQDAWSVVPPVIENTTTTLIRARTLLGKTTNESFSALIQQLNELRGLPPHRGHRDKKMHDIVQMVRDAMPLIGNKNAFEFFIDKALPKQHLFSNYSHRRQHVKISNINKFLAALNVFIYSLNHRLNEIEHKQHPVDSLLSKNLDDLEGLEDLTVNQDSATETDNYGPSRQEDFSTNNFDHNRIASSPITISREDSSDGLVSAQENSEINQNPHPVIATKKRPKKQAQDRKVKSPDAPEAMGGWYYITFPFIWTAKMLSYIPGVTWLTEHFLKPVVSALGELFSWIRHAFSPSKPTPKAATSNTREEHDFRDKTVFSSSPKAMLVERSYSSAVNLHHEPHSSNAKIEPDENSAEDEYTRRTTATH